MKIFISVADRDRPRIEGVVAALKQEHQVFFYKYSLSPGDAFHKQIREAIGHADVMLFFVTPRSIDPKRYTMNELEIARHRWTNLENHVLPVLLERVDISTVPPYLTQITFCEPKGDLAASVTFDVARMEQRLKRMGLLSSASRTEATESTGPRWLEGVFAGIGLGALTVVVCWTTWELTSELHPNRYFGSVIHGLILAALLWLAALYFDVRKSIAFAALTAGSVAAFLFDTTISDYLLGNFSHALPLVYFGKSLVLVAVAAIALPVFRQPQYLLCFAVAGLVIGQFLSLLGTDSPVQRYVWEALVVGLVTLVLSSSSEVKVGSPSPQGRD